MYALHPQRSPRSKELEDGAMGADHGAWEQPGPLHGCGEFAGSGTDACSGIGSAVVGPEVWVAILT
jgi:hypothetical protein